MEKQRGKPVWFLGKGTPLLVLLVALLLTACATSYVANSVQVKERERFNNEVQSIIAHLTERMDAYVELLRATRGLWAAAGGSPRPAQFHAFVRSLELENNFQGVQGIGFSARLLPQEVTATVAGLRSAGHKEFAVHPAGLRGEYHPILFLEPQDARNRVALGYDMFAEPVRRAAMERARDTGAPVLSGRVMLLQETDQERQTGFLLYLPVYRKGRPVETLDQRRAALLGFVYSPFRADYLFQAVLGPSGERGTWVEIHDGPDLGNASLLHDSAADDQQRTASPARNVAMRRMAVAGRLWTLRFRTTPAFEQSSSAILVPFVLGGGLAVSLLLFALSLLQYRERESAERASDELRQSGEALREAGRAKDEFLAMLGHELRNPLGAISNALQVMSVREISDPHLRRAHAVVERQIRHQTRLIEDLLDVSRVNSGKIALQCELVDFKEVVCRAVEGLQWAADEQQHRLITQFCEQDVLIHGDSVRLEQVVANLLHNAIKYTPAGGVVELGLHTEGRLAVLTVRDTGVGISAYMLGRIFDVFTQAQISIDRSKGGLGLGLTLVRNLVCMHGGSVEARSEGIGMGSEFLVRIPLLVGAQRPTRVTPSAEAETAEAETATPPSTRLQRTVRRVLIVEDIKDARETLQELLELQGYEVEAAPNGREGLAKLLESPPDVALIDIGLPGMSGYEIASRARMEPRVAGVRLVALTGYGQPEDRQRALDAGFDAHFVKPIDPAALERMLIA